MKPALATMKTAERLFFACPHCGGEDAHEATHLIGKNTDCSFGPWQCRECGWTVHGRLDHIRKSVTITKIEERPKPIEGWMLLRLTPSKADKPLWFVLEHAIGTRGSFRGIDAEVEAMHYYVNEHACPANLVRVKAIIEGTGSDCDDDPHGVLEFAAWAPKTRDMFDAGGNGDWRSIFPKELGEQVIDAENGEQALLEGPKQ